MTDEKAIVNRMLNVLPPCSVELQTFFKIFRVKVTRDVATACITCSTAPQLLVNPDFVDEHCKTDEHLFMLVMHELYHIILGHTRLFPHGTMKLNIVFDAVINAMLCNMFPGDEFTSFFTNLYDSNDMPYCLLRPTGPDTPPEALDALDMLYKNNSASTYNDIFEALKNCNIPDFDILLLGSHGGWATVAAKMRGQVKWMIS